MPDFGMHRDERDEWPDEDPNTPGVQRMPGKFDVSLNGVEGYPQATGHLTFVCPGGRVCNVLIGPTAVPRSGEDRLGIWGWNGDAERPTLSPSINCLAEKDGKPTGGCGWHGFIQNGVTR